MLTVQRTDVSIHTDVLEELDWDPQVAVTDVGVEVDDGVVTLTGTVDTYGEKHAAERAAFRVDDVQAVANDLTVHPKGLGQRDDTDIAKVAVEALKWQASVPADKIEILVEHGVVTLRGSVTWDFQRAAAVTALRKLWGVRSVVNQITITQPSVSSADIHSSIERALVRHAALDANSISLQVDGRHVTLSGAVRSWAECKDAEDAVWKAPGVTEVTNRLSIKAV